MSSEDELTQRCLVRPPSTLPRYVSHFSFYSPHEWYMDVFIEPRRWSNIDTQDQLIAPFE